MKLQVSQRRVFPMVLYFIQKCFYAMDKDFWQTVTYKERNRKRNATEMKP